jgi:hypothetical protein
VEFHQATPDSTVANMSTFFSGSAQIVSTTDDPRANDSNLIESLRVTEVMFAPDPAHPAAEYIELMNISDEALDLSGVRFTQGIRYVLPEGTMLESKNFLLLVHDRVAFEAAYGNEHPVVGTFDGRLTNGGETIALRLPEPNEGAIAHFHYDDAWQPLADGGGHARTISDVTAPRSRWDTAAG